MENEHSEKDKTKRSCSCPHHMSPQIIFPVCCFWGNVGLLEAPAMLELNDDACELDEFPSLGTTFSLEETAFSPEEIAPSLEELVPVGPAMGLFSKVVSELESLHAMSAYDAATIAANENPQLFRYIRIPPRDCICKL